MILTREKVNKIIQTGNIQTTKMGFSPEDMEHIMEIISTNIYKNKNTFAQELAANAHDTHLAAKVKDAVVIEIDKNISGKYYIKIKDWGEGISPERIKTFGLVGKSTKRSDLKAIGGYGIGNT